MGGVGGDDGGDDGELLATVWASVDAVSGWNGVSDVVDDVGDGVVTLVRARRFWACQADFRQRGEQKRRLAQGDVEREPNHRH